MKQLFSLKNGEVPVSLVYKILPTLIRDLIKFEDRFKFRLKPHTVTINGIDAPCCGENYQHGDVIYILDSLKSEGYNMVVVDEPPSYWWRTEDEIKQVVSALKTIFKTN